MELKTIKVKKTIRNILQEETSRQNKLINMISQIGLTNTARAVGGYKRLVKALENTNYFTIVMDGDSKFISYYLSGDRGSGNKSLYYRFIKDPYDFHDFYSEYDVYQLIQELNEENLNNVRKILSEKEGEDLSDTPVNELLWYDHNNYIDDALRNAANHVDQEAYGNHLYEQLEKALKEYGGEVLEMNDESLIFTVDLGKFLIDLEDDEINYVAERCGSDLVCLFDELKSDGWIEKPKPQFDRDWYNRNFDNQYFNEIFSENIYRD